MDLSSSVLDGLLVAGSNSLSNEAFSLLLSHSLKSVGRTEDTESLFKEDILSKLDHSQVKEAYSALTTLIIEAAKSGLDGNSISATLEECQFNPDRISLLQSQYKLHKEKLRTSLKRIGVSLPHIVDVDWRLDYYIKGKDVERVNKLVYLIKLKTEGGQNKEGFVQFTCTEEQLQDLVSRLREACKSCERLANN